MNDLDCNEDVLDHYSDEELEALEASKEDYFLNQLYYE